VAIKALRAEKTEGLLKGQMINSALINKAAEQVSSEIKPIDDIRSTAEYRMAMSKAISVGAPDMCK
jgi:carbon-monoxide dehydrogenase medium subunit